MSRRPISSLAAGALAALLAGPAVSEEGHFPVWISPSIGAATPAEAAAMLTRRLRINPDTPFEMEAYPYDDSKVRAIWNCTELEQALLDGYNGTEHFQFRRRVWSDCLVLRIVARGQPARRSTLRDFHLDEEALAFLPAAFGSGSNCESRELHVHANARRIPWNEIAHHYDALANEILFGGTGPVETTLISPVVVEIEEEDVLVALLDTDQYVVTTKNPRLASVRYNTVAGAFLPMGPDRMRVYTFLVDHELEIVARGDFNGDGFDDIVVWFDRRSTTGHHSDGPDTYLLTRTEPGAVLALDRAAFTLLAEYCQSDYETMTGERSPYPPFQPYP